MMNTPTIVSGEVRPKLLCPKVDDKVTIPGVIRGDVEEVFIGEFLIYRGSFGVGGEIRNESG